MAYDVVIDREGVSLCLKNSNGRLDDIGYGLSIQQINTEQKVLAQVFHLCTKHQMTVDVIHKFIEGCAELVPSLDIHTLNT